MSAEKVAARGAARTGAAGAKGLQGLAPPLIIERQMSLTAFVERAARDFLQFSLALPMRIRTPPGDYAHPPPAAQLPPISIAPPPPLSAGGNFLPANYSSCPINGRMQPPKY